MPTLLFNGYGEYVAALYKAWKTSASGRDLAAIPQARAGVSVIAADGICGGFISTNNLHSKHATRGVRPRCANTGFSSLWKALSCWSWAQPPSSLPPIATLAVTILLGWLFLVSGIVDIDHDVLDAARARLLVVAVVGVLGIVVGAMLLASPLVGAFSLTLVLITFFIVEGAASIMFAFDHRRELSGQWGWMPM